MKDKLLEESLKLDRLINEKCRGDEDPAIIFTYANINKIKFLASSERNYYRQNSCIKYISTIYKISDSTKEEIRSILSKHGIISHSAYMWMCLILFLCSYFIGLVYLDYKFSLSLIVLYIVCVALPLFFYMCVVEHISYSSYIRFYFIPKEYKGMKLEKRSLTKR